MAKAFSGLANIIGGVLGGGVQAPAQLPAAAAPPPAAAPQAEEGRLRRARRRETARTTQRRGRAATILTADGTSDTLG